MGPSNSFFCLAFFVVFCFNLSPLWDLVKPLTGVPIQADGHRSLYLRTLYLRWPSHVSYLELFSYTGGAVIPRWDSRWPGCAFWHLLLSQAPRDLGAAPTVTRALPSIGTNEVSHFHQQLLQTFPKCYEDEQLIRSRLAFESQCTVPFLSELATLPAGLGSAQRRYTPHSACRFLTQFTWNG